MLHIALEPYNKKVHKYKSSQIINKIGSFAGGRKYIEST